MITVESTMSTPPGGVWFWQDAEHSFADSSLDTVCAKVGAVLRSRGDPSDPEQAVLRYMAPRMPDGWARGWTGPKARTTRDLFAAGAGYLGRRPARADRIMSRMETCRKCPRMTRDTCLACIGVPQKVSKAFGGARPVLPCDAMSGVCECAGTFNMIVASVDYGPDEKAWPGTPSTCWRFLK